MMGMVLPGLHGDRHAKTYIVRDDWGDYRPAAGARLRASRALGRDLWAGLLHPISGVDHIVVMIALGIWAAQLGAPAIWVLPIAFPLVLALGGAAGALGLPVPGTEIGIASSAIVFG